MTKNLFLTICVFLLTILSACAQTTSLTGVYIGAQLYNTPFNGMQIDNIVIYFRSNGTFNNTLDQADWRTKVSGQYTISNGIVQLTFKNGDESKKYKLAANGNLESTAGIKHTLHKVKKVANVPAGTYEKRSASTSGGTGTPMVGAFSSNYLSFDGSGNFSSDRSSVVGVGGDAAGGTVGGKFDRNSKTGGTYKLGDAEITLTYGNGTVSKHSFFYSPPNEEDLILLDGEFYFRDDKKGGSTANQSKPVENNRPQTNTTTSATRTASGLPTTTVILAKLRSLYGGENIDKLNTVRETATIQGMQVISFTDLSNNSLRAEVRQNGELILVKQVEGNDGWQWMRGTKKPLTQAEKDELNVSIYQGIMGLHKKLSSNFLNGTVTASGDDFIVTFYKNKTKLIYLVGSNYALKGNAYTVSGGTPNISVYKNFTQRMGITYPAITETSDGSVKLTSTTTAIEFNPAIPADAWKVPVD